MIPPTGDKQSLPLPLHTLPHPRLSPSLPPLIKATNINPLLPAMFRSFYHLFKFRSERGWEECPVFRAVDLCRD